MIRGLTKHLEDWSACFLDLCQQRGDTDCLTSSANPCLLTMACTDSALQNQHSLTAKQSSLRPFTPPSRISAIEFSMRFADVPSTSHRTEPSHAGLDLLGGDDLLGGLADLSVSSTPAQPSLELRPNPSLSPAEFQSKWGSWPQARKLDLPLSAQARALIQPGSLQVSCADHVCFLLLASLLLARISAFHLST